jgi:LysR family transcriptional regulator, cyn operon transcriptional activator
MNIQQLRYVVATAETGNMTGAAATLFVAQPALSRGVRLLEKELEVTLFSRQGRGVALTPEGETFVARARRVLDSIDALRGVGDPVGPDAPLVLAASPTLQSVLAIPTLATLRQQGVSVQTRMLGCSSSEEVVDLVTTGRAGLGICDELVPSELAHLPIGRAEVKLYSPAAVDLPPDVRLPDLAGVPLVVPTPGTARREAIDGFFAHYGLTPTIAVESNERNAWLDAVRHGLASCIWHSVGSFGEPLDGIVARSFDPAIHQEFVAVHRPHEDSEAVRHLLAVLQQLADLTPA